MLTKVITYLIRLYQGFLSPDQGKIRSFFINNNPKCVFYPSCSDYSIEAFSKYGFLKGFRLSFLRVLRCHPWQKPKIDKVP